MEINRRGFPEINKDNDEVFLLHLQGVVDSIDELCSFEIVKTPTSYKFRIAPSLPKYINPIIKELTKFNNMYGIHLDFGKSIKTSSVITFNINQQHGNIRSE